jgi:hypothetical protein
VKVVKIPVSVSGPESEGHLDITRNIDKLGHRITEGVVKGLEEGLKV